MRLSAVAFFMILTTVFLSGCGKEQSQMAALDDRGANFYGRSGVSSLNLPTFQAVPAMSVSSNDLMAPSSSSQHAAASPFKPAATKMGSWQWPVNGKVTEKFGAQANGVSNEGIVIAASEGTPIKAAQAGEVAFVGEDTKNYGNIVILRHADGTMTSYSHAKEIIVKKGDKVDTNKTIAFVGQSGNAKMPELHFAVREGKASVDPLSKLPQQLASSTY